MLSPNSHWRLTPQPSCATQFHPVAAVGSATTPEVADPPVPTLSRNDVDVPAVMLGDVPKPLLIVGTEDENVRFVPIEIAPVKLGLACSTTAPVPVGVPTVTPLMPATVTTPEELTEMSPERETVASPPNAPELLYWICPFVPPGVQPDEDELKIPPA
jgi:hypothetical protein